MSTPLIDFDGMSEADFRSGVLIPLLSAMGYQEIDHYHGPNELGKDIIAWKEDVDGSREYVAIVAKVGDINARATGDAAVVATQVRQAFGSTFSDKTTGDNRHIHRAIVATTGRIRERAQRAVRAQIDAGQQRHLRFWDGEKVKNLVARYIVERSIPGLTGALQERLSTLEHFSIRPMVSAAGTIHRIEPKEDGITIADVTFTFPSTPEGDAAVREVERFFNEGGQVTIPGDFIQSFEKHEELVRVFGSEKPASLQLGPNVPGEPHPIRLQISTDSGPLFYEGLNLRVIKSGRRRAEFRTEPPSHPLQITIVLRDTEGSQREVAFNIEINPLGKDVWLVRQALRLWRAVANGSSVRVIAVDSDSDLLPEQTLPHIEPPPTDLLTYAESLAVIENHFGWDLTLPEHITQRDLQDAEELRAIVESGTLVQPFENLSLTISPLAEVDLLQAFPPDEKRWLRVIRDESGYEILDRVVELGPSYSMMSVTVTEEEHQRMAAQVESGGSISITFKAAPDCEGMETTYSEFIPEEQPGTTGA